MDEFDQQEKEVKEHFDRIELMPFETKFAQIEPQLNPKKPRKEQKFAGFYKIFAAVASVMVVAVGIVIGYLFWNTHDEPMVHYEDNYIKIDVYQLEDLTSIDGLYLPALSLLDIPAVNVGRHIETDEIVYFTLMAIYDDGLSFREIEITIILRKEYQGMRSNDYTNLLEEMEASPNKVIAYSQAKYEEPFYSYFIKYEQGDVRYYFHYKTIEENDLNSFFGEFLI